jgi:hypothetical protein
VSEQPDFVPLTAFLKRVPSIRISIGTGISGNAAWWVKFAIDISDPLAWSVVQELGYVLNYLSLNERLPTIFMPVSPPPYLNGGPGDFLSWVIECRDRGYTPKTIAEWLEGRLPSPVDDRNAWNLGE